MKEGYIKAIREACIEANPEIQEIKFGCEVWIGEKRRAVWDVEHRVMEKGDGMMKVIRVERYGSTEFFPGEYTVIGRPVGVADVLAAIGSQGKEDLFLRHDGLFLKWEKFTEGGSGHHGVVSTYVQWKLHTDRLEAQSEKCLKFLASLLV